MPQRNHNSISSGLCELDNCMHLKMLYHVLSSWVIFEVCNGVQDCPQTETSPGGEDEKSCDEEGTQEFFFSKPVPESSYQTRSFGKSEHIRIFSPKAHSCAMTGINGQILCMSSNQHQYCIVS